MLIAVFISVGAIVTPNMGDQLADTDAATVFAGTVIQLVGLVVGLVYGVALTVHSFRKGQRA